MDNRLLIAPFPWTLDTAQGWIADANGTPVLQAGAGIQGRAIAAFIVETVNEKVALFETATAAQREREHLEVAFTAFTGATIERLISQFDSGEYRWWNDPTQHEAHQDALHFRVNTNDSYFNDQVLDIAIVCFVLWWNRHSPEVPHA